MSDPKSDAPHGFPPPPPPPAKKTSGCVIALVASGVLVLLVVVGLFLFGWWFTTTDEGKAVMATVDVAMKSTQGPGPDALRAAGCKEGVALRYDQMNEAVKPLLVDAGAGAEAFADLIEVRCMDPKGPMTCDEVGKLYAAAETPSRDFVAIVSASQQDRCKVTMKPDGTPR